MKYLLPCTCGEAIVIDASQAGQQVTCACGKSQEVPTMRGIRALQPAEQENRRLAAAQKPAWSPLQGALFAGGLLLAFIGICAAAYCFYIVAAIDVSPPSQEYLAQENAWFDQRPVDELYNLYLKAREEGLGTPRPPLYVLAQRAEATYMRYGLIAVAAAAVGFLLAIGSFFIRPR